MEQDPTKTSSLPSYRLTQQYTIHYCSLLEQDPTQTNSLSYRLNLEDGEEPLSTWRMVRDLSLYLEDGEVSLSLDLEDGEGSLSRPGGW